MKYDPNIHNRRSIRLKGYHYSKAGLYFITICVQDRKLLFGEIIDGKMILNDAGKMVEKWYYELENKYPDKKCHEMIVMPNHFHCIVENAPKTDNHDMDAHDTFIGAHVGTPLRGRPDNDGHPDNAGRPNDTNHPKYGPNNKKYNATIGDAIGWFKTMTTNEYIRGIKNHNWSPFNGKLWQRNYWEHIIRKDQSYQKISDYIINNPSNWNSDKLYSL